MARYAPFARSSSSTQREKRPSGVLETLSGRRVFVLVSAVSVCGNQ
jgi:hypothetical protein